MNDQFIIISSQFCNLDTLIFGHDAEIMEDMLAFQYSDDSPLVNPMTQIEHSLPVLPTFIFFILFICTPRPWRAFSMLSDRVETESNLRA